MKLKPLGRTDLLVTELCLGTMTWGSQNTEAEGHAQIDMALEGDYGDIRAFVHALETSAEFIVIEDIRLAEGQAPDAPLSLSMRLSTYFRGDPGGA